MFVSITFEISVGARERLAFLREQASEIEQYFVDKFYGEDHGRLYIGIICVSQNFDGFFKVRRPKYDTEGKVYIHKGVQIVKEGMTLGYDLKLDYAKYMSSDEIELLATNDILNSLEVIKTIKKIKDFDYEAFRRDFEAFFWQVGWLS